MVRAGAVAFAKRERALSAWLNARFNKQPALSQKRYLLLFCLLFGGSCSWILYRSLSFSPPASGMPHHLVPGVGLLQGQVERQYSHPTQESDTPRTFPLTTDTLCILKSIHPSP